MICNSCWNDNAMANGLCEDCEKKLTHAPQKPIQEESEKYYLQDTRQYVGNCMLFWAKDGGSGYTCHLKDAQEYTKEEAFAQHRERKSDKPWKVSDMKKIADLMVDAQYLNRIEKENE